MKHDVSIIEAYCADNQLSINVNKTIYVNFKTQNKRVEEIESPALINNTEVKKAGCTRFLGITLDENLTFKSHIEELQRQLSVVAGKMFAARKILPLHVKKSLYNSLFNSKLTYGCEGWGGAYKTTLAPLQTLQNKMIKQIFNLPLLTPTVNLYAEPYFFIMPVRAQFDFRVTMMIYKMRKDLVFTNMSFDRVQHRYVNRRRSNLIVPTYRLNCGEQRFSVRATKLWNDFRNVVGPLPNNIGVFKRQLMFFMRPTCTKYLE